jgi:hypothetical protein
VQQVMQRSDKVQLAVCYPLLLVCLLLDILEFGLKIKGLKSVGLGSLVQQQDVL